MKFKVEKAKAGRCLEILFLLIEDHLGPLHGNDEGSRVREGTVQRTVECPL